MSLTDPIADMLTRIRNGVRSGKKQVSIRASNVCKSIAAVLKQEGYIQDFDCIDDGCQGSIRVVLKYDPEGRPVIRKIDRTSTPGRRVYASADQLPKVLGGMGIVIVSTSKGVMSDRNCRQAHVGGEVLCTVC